MVISLTNQDQYGKEETYYAIQNKGFSMQVFIEFSFSTIKIIVMLTCF